MIIISIYHQAQNTTKKYIENKLYLPIKNLLLTII